MAKRKDRVLCPSCGIHQMNKGNGTCWRCDKKQKKMRIKGRSIKQYMNRMPLLYMCPICGKEYAYRVCARTHLEEKHPKFKNKNLLKYK